MSYLGIGYSGDNSLFLKTQVEKYHSWLAGDRHPHFFGDGFVVLYDSNIAREFAKKCMEEAGSDKIILYKMEHISLKQYL